MMKLPAESRRYASFPRRGRNGKTRQRPEVPQAIDSPAMNGNNRRAIAN